MDVTDDADVSVQRTANSSISELKSTIPLLIFRKRAQAHSDTMHGNGQLRNLVRTNALYRMLGLLDPFQELPQLLDPALEEILKPLSEALVKVIPTIPTRRESTEHSVSPSFAICKLLCTICKIRGVKVVVRFLSNEAVHLENLVGGLEHQLKQTESEKLQPSWEEQYILLVWLSHLVLTPFPLHTIVRPQPGVSSGANFLKLPSELDIVSRICDIALSHLSSPGRERGACVQILVHLIQRPDMEQPNLMNRLLDLVMDRLTTCYKSDASECGPGKIHEAIGAFALLAGILKAADVRLIAPRLRRTCSYILIMAQSSVDSAAKHPVTSSAVTRKLLVKILRCATLAALALSSSDSPELAQFARTIDDILEDIIEQLMAFLNDPDTPVRYAASKALSIITLRLDPDMATEVMEAVVSSMDEGVLWDRSGAAGLPSTIRGLSKARDLSLVSSLRWQGLVLTLAQLLFRKAPRLETLPSIVSSLLLGLSFEQRSSGGISTGVPVRDAANFGLWAISRQYTTAELDDVEASDVDSLAESAKSHSVLQVIACELVCAACLDPSGNIRRGSSAALQELIGRHPDTIAQGINLVQTVDYHAVSLRSSALTKVMVAAGDLHGIYRSVLLANALGWRGVLSVDEDSRRWSAKAVGYLASLNELTATQTLEMLRTKIEDTQLREAEARHGLILAVDEIVRTVLERSNQNATALSVPLQNILESLWLLFDGPRALDAKAFSNPTLRPYLISEAAFQLLGTLLRSSSVQDNRIAHPNMALITRCINLIETCASHGNALSTSVIADTARQIFTSQSLNGTSKGDILTRWIHKSESAMRSGSGPQAVTSAWLKILSHVFDATAPQDQLRLRRLLLSSTTVKVEVEVRVAAFEAIEFHFRSLSTEYLAEYITSDLIAALQGGFGDFTTDQRGDIGSLVRVAALHAASLLPHAWLKTHVDELWSLLALAFGLSVERLDRVRSAAWACVGCLSQALPGIESSMRITRSTDDFSSQDYFLHVLSVASSRPERLLPATLAGLVSSAGNGSESVLRCSRQALQIAMATDQLMLSIELIKGLMKVLTANLGEERIATPTLMTIAYTFETGSLDCHRSSDVAAQTFRELFALVQKSHYKSTSIPRLLAATDIYTSLSNFPTVRTSCLKKLTTMLAHPFPLVRKRAAESLYCIAEVEQVLELDWSQPPAQLKSIIQQVKDQLLHEK